MLKGPKYDYNGPVYWMALIGLGGRQNGRDPPPPTHTHTPAQPRNLAGRPNFPGYFGRFPGNSPGNLDGQPGDFPGNPLWVLASPSAFPGKFRGCHFPWNLAGHPGNSSGPPPGNPGCPAAFPGKFHVGRREIPREIWTRPAGFGRLCPFWEKEIPIAYAPL